MAAYQVLDGHVLGHHGRVVTGGDVIDLSDTVATDPAIAPHIVAVVDAPVVETLKPVVAVPVPKGATTSPDATNVAKERT